MSEQSIKEIGQLYLTRKERAEVSKLVSLEQVRENRYNLMVERYVTKKEVHEIFDLKSLREEQKILTNKLAEIQTQLEEILV